MFSKFFKLNKKGFTRQNSIRQKLGGFTILELIAAIFIISVGMMGIINVVPRLISNTTTNSYQLTAAYLAQEGIEIVRNIGETNLLEGTIWNDGLTNCSTGISCEADYNDQSLSSPYGSGRFLNLETISYFYGYDLGTPTKFKRKITINSSVTNATVTVDVYWDNKGKTATTTVQENLYNWY